MYFFCSRNVAKPERGDSEHLNRYVAKSVQKAIGDGILLSTFRWVELQLKYLCSLWRRSTLLDRLGELPPGLEQFYEDLYRRNMTESVEEDAKAIKGVLSWLLIAKRPLTTSEMCELVYAPGERGMTEEIVLEICFDLVSLDMERDQFMFSHSSVREFLEKKPTEFLNVPLHTIATCASLSLIDVVKAEHYAILYWPFHAEEALRHCASIEIEQALHDFFSARTTSFARWNHAVQPLLPGRSPLLRRLDQVVGQNTVAVFVTACFGLSVNLRQVLHESNGELDIRTRNKCGADALYLASQYGHIKNVHLLLEKGADVNVQEGEYSTALQAASAGGHTDTYGTALIAASAEGHADIVRVLLEKAADVNIQGGEYGTALQAASAGGGDDRSANDRNKGKSRGFGLCVGIKQNRRAIECLYETHLEPQSSLFTFTCGEECYCTVQLFPKVRASVKEPHSAQREVQLSLTRRFTSLHGSVVYYTQSCFRHPSPYPRCR
nr:ankyrin repeat and sam domain-containing protein 3 [Quercus suber]